MLQYTIYVYINDEEDFLLPIKADEKGFEISTVNHSKTRRLVYKKENQMPSCLEINQKLEEIEKYLNVTIIREKETGKVIAGMECNFVSPTMVTKLQQWLKKESFNNSKNNHTSKYDWKNITEITQLIQGIKLNKPNKYTRLSSSLSSTEVFDKLSSIKELSQKQEKELWSAAQTVKEIKLWNKAEELAITNPEHPIASICRAKILKINDISFAFTTSILKKELQGKVKILFKLYSIEEQKPLPSGLTLLPLHENGEPEKRSNGEIFKITADGHRNEITFPLSCPKGERLIIAINFENSQIYEYFVT